MPDADVLAAVDTILAVLLTMTFSARVGYLRGKLKISAPATTGDPKFERAFRIHANTVENLVIVLPLLWIASLFYGGQIPFWLGLLWVLSRIVYAIGYSQPKTEMRGPGAGLGFLAIAGLLALSVAGLV